MVDKIKLCYKKKLDITKFGNQFKYIYRQVPQKKDKLTGKILRDEYIINQYEYKYNGLFIKYSLQTNKLIIEGRLSNILGSRNNRVYNLLDWMKENKFEEIIENINKKLYDLTNVNMDILTFKVQNVEISYNVRIENVGRYIELFNRIFVIKDDKRYINYVLENNKEMSGSYYIKSKSEYKNNSNNTYTINFYNKYNQLSNESRKMVGSRGLNVKPIDFELATDILRMEIQYGYRICNAADKIFRDILTHDFCIYQIEDKYKKFLGNPETDFYSYKAAKKRIKKSNITDKERDSLLKYIRNKYQNKKSISKNTEIKYNKKLAALGIHWYLIPSSWKIEYMESPIKVLKRQVV